MGQKFQEESRLLRGKEEVTAGTSVELTDEDANVRARELNLSSLVVDFDNESSSFASGDHTKDNAVTGSARGGIDFSVRMCVGYANHVDDVLVEQHLEYSKYLYGAGLNAVVVEPTGSAVNDGKWIFSPSVDADENTMTVELIDKQNSSYAIGYEFAGAMSTLTIGADSAGAPITANFSFNGKVSNVNEYTAPVPAFSYDSRAVDAEKQLPTTFLNTTVALTELGVDGVEGETTEFCIGSFSLDTGSGIAESTCQSDQFGILNNVITTRSPMLTIDPFLQSLSDFDFWGQITGAKEYKVVITRIASGETTFELEIPRGQIMSPNITASDGFIQNELSIRPLKPYEVDDQSMEDDYIITVGCVSYNTNT